MLQIQPCEVDPVCGAKRNQVEAAFYFPLVPAKAGTQGQQVGESEQLSFWIPAYAGMSARSDAATRAEFAFREAFKA
jgi:hypothetical protein